MSDCHGGNGGHGDDFAHNRIIFIHSLSWYREEGFTYIEVGDGEELWENPDLLYRIPSGEIYPPDDRPILRQLRSREASGVTHTSRIFQYLRLHLTSIAEAVYIPGV